MEALVVQISKLEGCGKTFLMDLFFKHVQVETKRRVHFNEFMLNIHKLNHKFFSQKLVDPAFRTSHEIAQKCHLLCLDEVQVTDIGDAMIMKRLFEIMWAHRIVLVVCFCI